MACQSTSVERTWCRWFIAPVLDPEGLSMLRTNQVIRPRLEAEEFIRELYLQIQTFKADIDNINLTNAKMERISLDLPFKANCSNFKVILNAVSV